MCEMSGFTITATVESRGTVSCSSSSHLPPKPSPYPRDSPVKLPPGRAKLATSPEPNGIAHPEGDDRDRARRVLGGDGSRRGPGEEHVDLLPDHLGHQRGQSVEVTFRPASLDDEILAFDPTQLAQAFRECANGARDVEGDSGATMPNRITLCAGSAARASREPSAPAVRPARDERGLEKHGVGSSDHLIRPAEESTAGCQPEGLGGLQSPTQPFMALLIYSLNNSPNGTHFSPSKRMSWTC